MLQLSFEAQVQLDKSGVVTLKEEEDRLSVRDQSRRMAYLGGSHEVTRTIRRSHFSQGTSGILADLHAASLYNLVTTELLKMAQQTEFSIFATEIAEAIKVLHKYYELTSQALTRSHYPLTHVPTCLLRQSTRLNEGHEERREEAEVLMRKELEPYLSGGSDDEVESSEEEAAKEDLMGISNPHLSTKDEASLDIKELRLSLKDNPLVWWKQHEFQYPRLARAARDYLSARNTSTSSRGLFSISEANCVTSFRHSLKL